MSKQTFLNLPPAKRERFLQVAAKEFALYDYQNASLTKIVKILSIAKGSLYQYFENKKDIYHFLVESATERKLKAIGDTLNKVDSSFFKWYRNVQTASVLYDIHYPVDGLLLRNLAKEEHSVDLGNLALRQKEEGIDFYKNSLKQHFKGGGLDAKPNYTSLAYILVQTSIGMLDLVQLQLDFELRKHLIEETNPVIEDEDVEQIIKKVVKQLQGLA